MIWLNRTLNILLVIFSITSLILGVLLYERRQELRDRGEKLADALSEVVKALDENSGTTLQKDVHRKDFSGPDGATMAGGTLGWAYFQESYDPDSQDYTEFNNVLGKVKKQASDVREQRDTLASTLAEVNGLFNFKGTTSSNYQNVTEFGNAKKALFENLEKVRQRDQAIVLKIQEIANKIGTPLDKETLVDPENFEEPLSRSGVGSD